MKKILKIFVVGAIAALLGIIMGCSASAIEFNTIEIGPNAKGTIVDALYPDAKSGMTFEELVESSIYQDVSYFMDMWVSSLEKNTFAVNSSKGMSILYKSLAEDLTHKGIAISAKTRNVLGVTETSAKKVEFLDYKNPRSVPGLVIPSTSWASVIDNYLRDYFISGDEADLVPISSDSHAWLNFCVNNSVYSYQLYYTDAQAHDIYSSSVTGAHCSEIAMSDMASAVRNGVYKALSPYAFIIYEYKSDKHPEKLSSSTLTADNLVPAYLIHPLCGVVPLDDFVTRFNADSLWVQYDKSAVESFASWYDKYIVTLTDSESDAKLLSDCGSDDSVLDFYIDDSSGGVLGTTFIQDYASAGSTSLNLHGFILHPDYITWAMRAYSRADKNNSIVGFSNVPTSLDTALSNKLRLYDMDLTFINNKGVKVTYNMTKLVHTLYPVATIAAWRCTDTYGIYSYELKGGMGSRVSTILDKKGCRPSLTYESAGYAYYQLFGSHYTSHSYESNVGSATDVTITLENNNIPIKTVKYTDGLYLDIMTNKLYKVSDEQYACQYARCTYSDSNYAKGALNAAYITFNSAGLLYDYTEMDIDGSVFGTPYIAKVDGAFYPSDYVICSKFKLTGDTVKRADFNPVTSVVVSTFNEAVVDNWTVSVTNATGQAEKYKVKFYVCTGRKVAFDYANVAAMNLVDTNGAVKYVNSDTAAAGVYFNTGGRVSTTSSDDLKMKIVMLRDGPAIVLSDDYVQESGLLNWLETSAASSYMSSNVSYSGYTADLLYKRLTSKGVTLNPGASEDDQARYDDIATELSGKNASSVMNVVLTFISFVGLILMVYACALVIAYYIDIFNTVSDVSILNIITFGNCRAVHSKEDLADLGITDPKEKRKYCTQFSIIGRWALTMGFGILLFASNQVYISILRLYLWLMSLVG